MPGSRVAYNTAEMLLGGLSQNQRPLLVVMKRQMIRIYNAVVS